MFCDSNRAGGFGGVDIWSSARDTTIPLVGRDGDLFWDDALWRRRCVRYFRDFCPTNGDFAGVRTFGEQVKHAATMI